MTETELQQLTRTILEWHNRWCHHLQGWCLRQYPPVHWVPPSCRILTKGGNRSGVYQGGSINRCTYFLPYLLIEGAKYEETVAHEVCHSLTRRVMPQAKSHGDLFFYFLRVVCGYKNAIRCHHSDPRRARRIGRQLKGLV